MLPLLGRGKLTVALLAAAVLMALISAWSAWDLKSFTDSLTSADFPAGEWTQDVLARASRIDDRQLTIARVELVLLVLTAVVFLMWFARAVGNLQRRALRIQATPGWAVGGFFVPILSLFRPYQIMVEVWKGSATLADGRDPMKWRSTRASSWILVWWISWTAGNVVAVVGLQVESRDPGAATLDILESLLQIPAAIACMWLVHRISDFQARTSEHDGEAPSRQSSPEPLSARGAEPARP